MVEKYKRENTEDYSQFLDLIQWKRQVLDDKNSAKIKVGEMRLAVSIPQKLLNQLTLVLNGIEEERFLEAKGEMKWFTKKFPEFLIPYSY